jgi:hypothetical protein
LRDPVNPLSVFQLLSRYSLRHIEKLLSDESFELAEGFSLEDAGDLLSFRGYAFTENEPAEFLKEGLWRI